MNFLIKSLTEGLHTGINPLPTIPLECKNLLSVRQGQDTITRLIDDELKLGKGSWLCKAVRYYGRFQTYSNSPFIVAIP